MCGIYGIVTDKPLDIFRMQEAGNMLGHRGPDASGIWTSKNNRVGLGHTRLAIIDLSANACQPMSNEACPGCGRRNGSNFITYNGEVYNFQEIRADLEKKGHVFKSLSDTEVVLHSYEEWGEKCVDRFSGMFAFAIWDEKNQRLFLARDRIGKKPLFYYWDGKLFAFASEMRALLALNISKSVDLTAVYQYLTYQYIPAPHSVFENVFKLPPAHCLSLQDKKISVKRYWSMDFSKKIEVNSEEDLSADVFARLKESVRKRLISDVPFGAFLSGGIDSSIVVALMSELMDEPVKTFSIGFEEDAYNELPRAREIAELFKTDHHEFIVKFDALNVLPELVRHYGEPFADSSALPTYYLSKMTSDFVKVALSGDGGDESFAGYDRYYALKLMRKFRYVPGVLRSLSLKALDIYGESAGKSRTKRLKRFIQGSLYPQGLEYLHWMTAFSKEHTRSFYGPAMQDVMSQDPYEYLITLFKRSSAGDIVEKAMDADIHSYLPFDLLVKVDIASMANSLEVRCPFLDHGLMEFAASIPPEYKLNGRIKKYILRKAFKGLVPEKVFTRQKTGFGVPVSKWFRHDLKDYISDTLLSRVSLDRGYFRPEAVRSIVSEHISGKKDHGARLWTFLMLELWHREFMDT
ncbi:asparagine synthetase [glutamine-hydrolyzing] 1 [bacterium BMS3Bbin08]|nr:asparagine synthetase [glutamine-hydrolyzing] 1 [bacterium BMS3Bbin08]